MPARLDQINVATSCRTVQLPYVAEAMGHTTAGITERIYTHAFNRDAREERIRQAQAGAEAAAYR